MTESNKLSLLRDKLVHRRRAIVERFQAAPIEVLDVDEIAQIQIEIEAVDRAIAEESRAEFRI